MSRRSLLLGFIVLCSLIPSTISLADSHTADPPAVDTFHVGLFDTGISLAVSTLPADGTITDIEPDGTDGFTAVESRSGRWTLTSDDDSTQISLKTFKSYLVARMVRTWPGGQKEQQSLTINFEPAEPPPPELEFPGTPTTTTLAPVTTTTAAPATTTTTTSPPATTTTTSPPATTTTTTTSPPATTTTTTTSPPPTSTTTTTSPPSESNVVYLSGDYPNGLDTRDGEPAGTLIDASDGSFHPHKSTALRIYNIGDSRLLGGYYTNSAPDNGGWSDYKSATAIALRYSPGVTVEGVAIDGAGDGISFGAGTPDWTLKDSYIGHAIDDAIENDYQYNGVVDNILVDWGYAFFSCRVGSSRRYNGSAAHGSVTIKNSLVRLAPQGNGGNGGRLWKQEKYDTPGCGLRVHNNVFLYEPGSYYNTYLDPSDEDDIDYQSILDASGNIVVWLGEGPFPERVPEGFTVTTDRSVWTAARAAWFDAHPAFSAYE
ncbi:MAG: hypothetical protein ACR2OI_06980 [Acidimicrobiia bacterium]